MSIRPPALLLGTTLLLWGWQQELMVLAAVMAVAVEAWRWVGWHWRLVDRDLQRLADLGAIILVLVTAFQFDAHSFRGIYGVLKWMPVVLFPVVVGQLYSGRTMLKFSVFVWSLRRAEARGATMRTVDIRYPYFVLCLVSAAAGKGTTLLYFALFVVMAWWIIANRSSRYAVWVVAVIVLLSGTGGFAIQKGVLAFRGMVEPTIADFLRDRVAAFRDPFQSHTSMGSIGRLKLSDRIVMRVKVPSHVRPPLLREASYQFFSRNVWLAGNTKFDPLNSDRDGTRWKIIGEESITDGDVPTTDIHTLQVSRYSVRGKSLLAVPTNTFEVADLNVEALNHNPLGALKVVNGPRLIEYTAAFAEGRGADMPPNTADLAVPGDMTKIISELAEQLELSNLPPDEAIKRIRDYLATDFKYDLVLPGRGDPHLALETFLTETRRGHCEFFGSATVLLLRASGIPARYATGYLAHEWSRLEDQYLIRRRDAHAWALAYVDGRWANVDTTPAAWPALDSADTGWWVHGYDVLAWLRFEFAKWRQGGGEDRGTPLRVLWVLAPLMAILVWRLIKGGRVHRVKARAGPSMPVEVSGGDSEFYLIVKALQSSGYERSPWEPLGAWLGRLAARGELKGARVLLKRLLPLHYRYRFDPEGLEPTERAALKQGVRDWLAELRH